MMTSSSLSLMAEGIQLKTFLPRYVSNWQLILLMLYALETMINTNSIYKIRKSAIARSVKLASIDHIAKVVRSLCAMSHGHANAHVDEECGLY